MANDSASAGFLTPTEAPRYDDQLEDDLHSVLVGVTGLPPEFVRPRWQPEPPNQPPFEQDWLAFGVVRSYPDTFGYQGRNPAGSGSQVSERDEVLEFLLSFFGPRAQAYEMQLRVGLAVEQNYTALRALGFGFIEQRPPVRLPALFKQKWVNRIDSTLVLTRRAHHVYSVFNLQSATAAVQTGEFTSTADTDLIP